MGEGKVVSIVGEDRAKKQNVHKNGKTKTARGKEKRTAAKNWLKGNRDGGKERVRGKRKKKGTDWPPS